MLVYNLLSYCREFLDEEKIKHDPSTSLTPSTIEKLINVHFPDWLEQKVNLKIKLIS